MSAQLSDTDRLKLLVTALRLRRQEVARAATLGGINTSSSRADSWLRGSGAARERPGAYGETRYRDREISAEEFDAVLLGLAAMLAEIEPTD